MIIKLPLTSDPAQDFITQLGSSRYRFYVRFNDRGGFWTMSISDPSTNTAIISGMPLVLGCDMLEPYLFGNGKMIAYDESGSSQDAGDPDTNDLGNRINVYWFSDDEVV